MISFDWALKRLLRNKANFGVLEGFLSELLHQKITITNILESESNKDGENDKFNRVDLFAEDDKKEIIIIELQFNGEYDYFQRMLYGTSKAIAERMTKKMPYSQVRKVYSINIVYFDLGAGNDYIYRGFTDFKGLHTKEELKLSENQKKVYKTTYPGDLYPEYYIIKVTNFNDVAKDTLDEWVYYLKTNKIKDEFTAQGLDQAREVLAYDNLSDKEKQAYDNEAKRDRIKDSEIKTAFIDGEIKGEAKGKAEGEAERQALEKALEKEKAEREKEKIELEKEKAERQALEAKIDELKKQLKI